MAYVNNSKCTNKVARSQQFCVVLTKLIPVSYLQCIQRLKTLRIVGNEKKAKNVKIEILKYIPQSISFVGDIELN